MPASSASAPAFEVLTNDRYSTLITPMGSGFSAFDEYLLTAWRADPIEGNCGLVVFVRDLGTGRFWTACGRPVPGQLPGELIRDDSSVTVLRSHDGVASRVETSVHATAGIEQRSISLRNDTTRERELEFTTFVEVALNRPASHDSHPAFSKLFVQTKRPGNGPILVATRRPRDRGASPPVLMHGLFGAPITGTTSDRATFIGRGCDLAAPRALIGMDALDDAHGNVLDPALSLRCVVRIPPGALRTVRTLLGAGDDSSALQAQVESLAESALDRNRALRSSARYARGTKHSHLVTTLAIGLDRESTLPAQPASRMHQAATGGRATSFQATRFFNGHGGFTAGGREYVIQVTRDGSGRYRLPPAPWTNVIANPGFGCIVSETGAGTTWSRNSREHRLTPWSNDAVVDPHADALYVRDQETGAFWSPTPGPAPAHADFEVRHGFGYSTWHHEYDGLVHEVTVFVPNEDALRLTRVRIRNAGAKRRLLAVYAYNRWVLGTTPEFTRANLQINYSPAAKALLVHNKAAAQGLEGIAFAATNLDSLDGWCADRGTFLGVPGSVREPAALLTDGTLQPITGDPCAVLQALLDLQPGQTGEVTFLLGEASSAAHVARLLETYRQPGQVEAALRDARSGWTKMFSRLQVETPSPALDLMLNGWLTYQAIACRMWARSAFYQAGGAFGFRDQIQDAAALVNLRPDLTRSQILLHASHQFVEGDVLHWWHPPRSQGLRTRFADDLLWLPWATAQYIRATGERNLLDEQVRYVESRALMPGEAEAFVTPSAAESGDLYEHCCRAIDRSLSLGSHGLPYFGCGDWNDGMNRVGAEGRGESAWMGFFLYNVLGDFLPYCELRADTQRRELYAQHRERLHHALNTDGWDGEWYRRGWYDNGAVLGSKDSDECRIDALAQSWAVISRAAPAERVTKALDSVEKYLVDDGERLIRLLTPPFENTPNDPGYIKGYVAGVRENGGQYTHAATWVVRAMAEAGRRDRALHLLEGLLPINHSLDAQAASKYKVEPYVVAADIYGAPPHVGRGGWTWYTGSAGWMYRVAIESILGFTIENGGTLCLSPRIPDAWRGFRLSYEREDGTRMEISVRNPGHAAARIASAQLDGKPLALRDGTLRVPMMSTGRSHSLDVVLGK